MLVYSTIASLDGYTADAAGKFDCILAFMAAEVEDAQFGQRAAGEIRDDLPEPHHAGLDAGDVAPDGVDLPAKVNVGRRPRPVAIDQRAPFALDLVRVHCHSSQFWQLWRSSSPRTC